MIVVRIWEGLGNQMFQYAYARLLQQKTGKKVVLEGRRIYLQNLQQEDLSVKRKCRVCHYDLKLPFIRPEYLRGWSYLEQSNFMQKIKYYLAIQGMGTYMFCTDEADMFGYHEKLLEVRDNTYVMGHFLNRRYIDPIRELLIKDFSLVQQPILPDSLVNLMNHHECISVHFRRGDYLYAECAQVVNEEMRRGQYYKKAMAYICDKVKNPVFLFFSDDIEWVKQNIECQYPHYYVSGIGLKDYEELTIMAQCQHNIIANSTFSFWAGWLNQSEEKIVIAPKHWMPSIVPKDWIQI